MAKGYKHIETAVIHEGYNSKHHLGSLVPPIFQSATFVFDSAEQGERRFAGEEAGYIYSRLGNPTVTALENRIAVIEGGEAGLAFGSGMGAVSAVLMALTKANEHIICSNGLYGCTFGLLNFLQDKYNISHDFSDMKTAKQIEALIRPETVCIYVETPVNPTMKMIDLAMISNVAKKHGIYVVVDNTFASPYLQTPLALGCDIVLHSATKYICGHGDVIAGLAVGSAKFISELRKTTLKDIGAIMTPFDAWLLLRGIKTLPIRMDRHSENANKIFQKLKNHPSIDRVYYPEDNSHPDYPIFKKQMKKGGGILSFEIKGTKIEAQKLLNQLSLIQIAVSLGDAETLIQHPGTMTHAGIPEESRRIMGITDQLIRLSVGLENWEDIWEDLNQALNTIHPK